MQLRRHQSEGMLKRMNSKRPAKRDIFVGTLTVIFGFLFLPSIFLFGYLYQNIRSNMDSEQNSYLPSFTEAGIVKNGILVFILWFVYFAIPIFFIELFIQGAASTEGSSLTLGFYSYFIEGVGIIGGEPVNTFIIMVYAPIISTIASQISTITNPVLLLTLSISTSLLAFYLYPAALANAAAEDRFSAGLDVQSIFQGSTTWQYLQVWAIAMILSLIGWVFIYSTIFVALIIPGNNFRYFGAGGTEVAFPTQNGLIIGLSIILSAFIYFMCTYSSCLLIGEEWRGYRAR